MKDLNPKLITLAREFRGKSQSQLAEEIEGLSQGNLSRLENGIIGVSEEVLLKIAENLNFPVDFFYGSHVKTPISEFYYRKRMSLSKKDILLLEANFDLYRIVIDKLIKAVDIPNYDIPQFDLELGGSPEQIARKVRKFLNIEKGPIENPVNLLEKHGIIIILIDSTSDNFDGMAVYTDSGQPTIFLNKNMPNDRKRFSLAHELGHLVMHIPFDVPTDRDEDKEADKFASEFCIPELDSYNSLVNLKFNDLPNLKRYWKMSMASIIYKAKSIEAIESNTAKNLMIELSRRGWRKQEIIDVPLDTPKILKQLIQVYMEELEYDFNEIAMLLSLNQSHLKALVETNSSPKSSSLKIA